MDAESIEPVAQAVVEQSGAQADESLTALSPSDLGSLGHLPRQLLGPDLGPDGGSAGQARQAEGGEGTGSLISWILSVGILVVPAPEQIEPDAAFGEVELDGLEPLSDPLQGGAFPSDLGSLDRALERLLGWLDDLGETLAGWSPRGELLAWIMAMALVSATCEITRRELRRTQLGTGLDGLLPFGPQEP